MPLQQDTVSIDLARGVNNKIDDKIAGPDQTSTLVDARFDKDKRLVKRNGITAQSQNFINDPNFMTSVTFSSAGHRSKVFAHGNQLCIANNGSLFTQYQGQDKWVFQGTYVPMAINLNRLDANVQFFDTVTVAGVTVTISSQSVYVSEESTNSIISKTPLISEVGLRSLGFQSSAYVLTQSSSTNTIFARAVNLANGAIGPQVAVVTDYNGYSFPINLTITSSASSIGEAAFISYLNTSQTHKVIPFLSIGSVSSLGALVVGSISQLHSNVKIEQTINPNRLHIAGPSRPVINGSTIQAWTFTASTYTNTYSTNVVVAESNGSTSLAHTVTMASPSTTNRGLMLYFDYTYNLTTGLVAQYDYSNDGVVSMVQVSSGGGVLLNNVYSRGLLTIGECFRDNARNVVYLPLGYKSPLQSTVLLADTLEGQNSYNYFVGKTLYGQASNNFTSSSSFIALSQTYPTALNGDIYRIVNNGYFVDFDLTPQNSPQSQFFANTTHLNGGLLWAYDGTNLSEHNFLIMPEQMQASLTSAALGLVVNVVGSNSGRERFTVTTTQAQALKRVNNQYFTFYTSTASGGFYVWYTVDGLGTDPAVAGKTGLGITLLGTDTAEEAAYKTWQAIQGSAIAGDLLPAQSNISGNTMQFTLFNSGSVGAPAVAGTGRTGALSTVGSYQYSYVYRWNDKNGSEYRSAPSVPVTQVVNGTTGGSILIWAPSITNKIIDQVRVELYRTEIDGTSFHLLDTLTMSSSSSRIGYFDNTSDSDISDNELLYTDGGILENYNIGACKTISYFKERLIASGVDDKASVYYSKAVVTGEPVNFTAETFFNVDADENEVSAVAPMDDKLIVFKSNFIYAMSGDGANDLGQGSTLSPPLLVASDAGTSIPNSVILYPNGLLFKSAKGIYSINRSLGVEYTGSPVENYNAFLVSGASLMKQQTEIRFTLQDTSSALVYNYFFNRWDSFSNYQSDSCAVWNNKMTLIRNTGKTFVENSGFFDVDVSSISYSMYLETPWLKLKGIQDFQRIYQLGFLGEYLSPHTLTVNVSYDYDNLDSNADVYLFNSTDTIGTPPGTYPGATVYQFEISLIRQKCEAIKVKITENPGSGSQASLYLNNMSAYVGLKKGMDKLPPEKQI